MAIYLVDYENVYIEGLQGMERLTGADKLHIFYTQNRCGLTFGLYEQLIACQAQVQRNEVAVSLKNSDPVKNALDIQLMMFTGYLIGAHASDALYIVSKDKDFLLGTEFYERFIRQEGITLQIVPSIEASLTPAEPEAEEPEPVPDIPPEIQEYPGLADALQRELDVPSFAAICDLYAKPEVPENVTEKLPLFPEPAEEAPLFTVQYFNTVRNLLGKTADEETVSRVCEMISVSDTLVDFNNALARYYHDGQRAKVVYHKFKSRFEDLRHLARAGRK